MRGNHNGDGKFVAVVGKTFTFTRAPIYWVIYGRMNRRRLEDRYPNRHSLASTEAEILRSTLTQAHSPLGISSPTKEGKLGPHSIEGTTI